MPTKTFQSNTMAEALAQVKRELGPHAIILKTRSERVGAVLGVGGRDVVTVLATNEEPPDGTPTIRLRTAPPAPPAATSPLRLAPDADFTPTTFRTIGRVVGETPDPRPTPVPASSTPPTPPRAPAAPPANSGSPRPPAPKRPAPVTLAPLAPVNEAAILDLRADLDSISSLVNTLKGASTPAADSAGTVRALLVDAGLDTAGVADLLARARDRSTTHAQPLTHAVIHLLVARLVRKDPALDERSSPQRRDRGS